VRPATTGALALTAALALGLVACSSGGGHASNASTSSTAAAATTPTTTATTAPAPNHTVAVRAAPWTLPAPLDREVAVTVDGKIFVLGGNRDGGTSAIADVIDPATGAATRAGLLARPAHDAAGGVIGGRPTVFGGGASTVLDAVQQLPASGPTRVIGHLPRGRADLSSATLNGVVYLVGGYDGSAPIPDVLATTDGVTFRTVGRLAVPVRYPAVAAIGGQLFVVGGATSGGEDAGVDTDVVQRVDLATGAVSVVAHLGVTRSHAAAVVLGGTIYVLGGHVGGHWTDEVARLDPASGTLTVVAHLPQAVSDAATAVIGSTAYLLGGETGPNRPVSNVAIVSA
jgi:Kelch motif